MSKNFVMRLLVSHKMMSEKCQRKNSILMTGQYLNYPDLGSAFNWLKQISLMAHPIRSTYQFLVVICCQYEVFLLIFQRSVSNEIIDGGFSKCPLFFWCLSYSMFLLAGKFSDMENKWLGILWSLTNLLKYCIYIYTNNVKLKKNFWI